MPSAVMDGVLTDYEPGEYHCEMLGREGAGRGGQVRVIAFFEGLPPPRGLAIVPGFFCQIR